MARSTPADYREFIRVAVDLPLNPKLARLNDPAAGWAYVTAMCYCGQNLTDGLFSARIVLALAGVDADIATHLVGARLWHEAGHDCPRCVQPEPGMLVIHDYLGHQRSADEAKSLRETRREAGRKGAHTRWSSDTGSKSHSKSHDASDGKRDGNGAATGVADAWQTDDKSMAEVEVEVEVEKKTSSSSSTSREPQRDDVDHLCALIAAHAEHYDERKPRITDSWRKSMRLLLDSDLRSEADPLALAVRVFEWMQNNNFWPPVVRSAPTFRKQFGKMRAQAKHEWELAQRNAGRHLAVAQPQQGTASQRANAFLALRKGEPA